MIFPPAQDRGVVVFLVWNNLPFARRLILGAILLLVGLAVQAVTWLFWPGLPFLAAGTLLFLVRGFDNRVDFGKFDPALQWENVPWEKLEQLTEHDRRMARWDRSALDITNNLGRFVLLLFAIPVGFIAFNSRGPLRMLLLDALVILVPHWITGTRGVMRQPNLMLKADLIRNLVASGALDPARHTPQLLMLLKGEPKVPDDLKFKVTLAGQSPQFLGVYGQLVINRVQGKPYPYFYVVLVAKPGAGLRELSREYLPPPKLLGELKVQSDVEVLVVRQQTTKTSGYHTNPRTMQLILAEGLRLAEAWTSAPTTA
ncbi:MAG: hypothetical protein KJ072_14700 [Verrucomicrobia bacterium]|nr:hypothetical protein [Verrucomicrobiota bacterium]